jgi:hypothetical protein
LFFLSFVFFAAFCSFLLLLLFRFPTSPRLPSDRSVVGVGGDVGIDGASILVLAFSVFGCRLPAMSRDVGVAGVVNGA